MFVRWRPHAKTDKLFLPSREGQITASAKPSADHEVEACQSSPMQAEATPVKAHIKHARARAHAHINTQSDAVLFWRPSEVDEALSFLVFAAV